MFVDRIPAQPPSREWVVRAEDVGVQPRLGVLILGGGPEGHLRGQPGRRDEGFPEGAIFVMRGDAAGGVEVFADVAVAVVGRVIDTRIGRGVDLRGEQPADAARALCGAAEVRAPGVAALEGDQWRGAGGVNVPGVFGEEIPAVVEEVGAGATAGRDFQFVQSQRLGMAVAWLAAEDFQGAARRLSGRVFERPDFRRDAGLEFLGNNGNP